MEKIKAPRGTQDILPQDSGNWQYFEQVAREVSEIFGFSEIRTPIFEHTELFSRSVGDTTDVVQKEMYTFTDKGDRSITLRPEMTAGVVRSIIERGLLGGALPLKVYYNAVPCFRYEKPQAGRLRQFHQFGAEVFGASDATADAQLIMFADSLLSRLGIDGLSLEINSIGCPNCRPTYHEKLKEYFESKKDELCTTCGDRLDKNPMRILDCKNDSCKKIAESAPVIIDFLCDECSGHFEKLKSLLNVCDVEFSVNAKIVRGLDYYTKTVFEFVSNDIGSQGTVCGGGRYDGLVKELGGQAMPGLGFAMGVERLMLVMQAKNLAFPESRICDIYIAPMGEAATEKSAVLATKIRSEGFWCETDLMGRSLKAQMKYADKIGAKYVVVLGDNEISTGVIEMKDMQSGETQKINLDEIVDKLYDMRLADAMKELTDSIEKGQGM